MPTITRRAKIRHLDSRAEDLLAAKPKKLTRRSIEAKKRFHAKVNRDIHRLLLTLEENTQQFINGDFRIPKGKHLTDKKGAVAAATIISFSTAVSLMGIKAFKVGDTSGGVIGSIFGISVLTLFASSLANSYKELMRAEFSRISKILKKKKVFIAQKGEELSQDKKSHNKRICFQFIFTFVPYKIGDENVSLERK